MNEKDKKVVLLVGNGFNFFLNQYINDENEDVLLSKLQSENIPMETAKIWLDKLRNGLDGYCHLLDFLQLENYSETGETLLSKLNDFFEDIKGEEKGNEKYQREINVNLEKLVVNKIDSIFKETAIVEDEKQGIKTYINATARKLMFNNLKQDGRTFAKNIDNLVKKISNQPYDIYTTNYDFIVESVFTEYNGYKKRPVNFETGEHFIQLHGHYDTNGNSNIICCSPKEKMGRISPEVFQNFLENIDRADVLILFGMGLTSDPHILTEINKKENIDIIVIDADKDKYYKNHFPKNHYSLLESNKETQSKKKFLSDRSSFRFLLNNRIYFIDTFSHEYRDNYFVDKISTPENLQEALESIFDSILAKAGE